MSVAEYLTPNKNHLTHDTVTPTEQPSDLYLSGPRELLVTKPSDRMTSSDSNVEVEVDGAGDVSHTATSTSPGMISSSYPLPPASSPTLPYPSALAHLSDSLSTTLSLSLSSSSNLMTPLLSVSSETSSNTPTTTTATTTSTSDSTTSTSASSHQTLAVDVATTSTQRKALTRGVSLPDSSDFYDDEIEEVAYGGVRPDVWCDDEPASIASRDLCTMEIISLLL